jgi:hypothetical protein
MLVHFNATHGTEDGTRLAVSAARREQAFKSLQLSRCSVDIWTGIRKNRPIYEVIVRRRIVQDGAIAGLGNAFKKINAFNIEAASPNCDDRIRAGVLAGRGSGLPKDWTAYRS